MKMISYNSTNGPVLVLADGLPVACSIVEGLDLPVIDAGYTVNWRVMLDGEEAERVVAFDRFAGFIWRYTLGEPKLEKLTGRVRVEVRP